MTTLQFADTHNLVVFLSKPAESEGFEQIVDFLNANPIRYALTINPTIYTLCIEQFWATVKAKTINGEVQLQALVDGKKIIITESIVRRDLQLEDAEGIDYLPNATIFEQLTLMRPKRKDTEIPQSSGPTDNVADEAVNKKMGTSSGGGPKRQETMGDTIAQTRLKLDELMEFCTKLQQRVLDLENTKTAQAQEITSLKLRVKKLEKKGGSRTHKLKRLYKGRKIDDIDKDAEITLIDKTQGRYGDDLMFDTGVLNDEKVFAGQDMDEKEINVAEKEVSTADLVTTAGEVVTTVSPIETTTADDLTLAQTLIEIRSEKYKVKGVVIGEQSESTTRIRPQQLPSKDKGKGIMEEPEKPTKKKDQIRHDEEVSQRNSA
ncbi:hypothetical protein Tco_0735980 [Tanacetum coccineum]